MSYEFLFMHASGGQLGQISSLVEQGAVLPVVGRIVPFDRTVQALQEIDKGGIRGKTVISAP